VRDQNRSVAAAIAVVFVVAGLILFALSRGGVRTDEEAIREWFSSPAGGAAPPDAVRAIHVPACNFAGYRSGSEDVLSCELVTSNDLNLDIGARTVRGCFVISNDNVLRGGRQLKGNGECKPLRYDSRTHALMDVETGRHYPIETVSE